MSRCSITSKPAHGRQAARSSIKTVDWYYHRTGCITCSRADAYLAAEGIEILERVPASRRLQASDALSIARASSQIWVAKGKKVDRLDLERMAEAELVPYLLGPTGNLRAPLLRFGGRCLVGFNEALFAEFFAA